MADVCPCFCHDTWDLALACRVVDGLFCGSCRRELAPWLRTGHLADRGGR